MAKLTRHDALGLSALHHIPLGRDFHSLDSSQVESVIAAADTVKYRAPANRNGSRARYFFAYLQRLASRDSSRDA